MPRLPDTSSPWQQQHGCSGRQQAGRLQGAISGCWQAGSAAEAASGRAKESSGAVTDMYSCSKHTVCWHQCPRQYLSPSNYNSTSAHNAAASCCSDPESAPKLLLLQDLVKLYEAKDQKCDELRAKYTAAKSSLSARERELDTAQRLLQKSAAEKSQLKVSDCMPFLL